MRLSRTIRVAGALAAIGVALYLARPSLLQYAAQNIEQRLHSETGLSWKLAGGLDLCFDSVPCLLLHDVSADAASGAPARESFKAHKVRMTGDFAVLFGKAGVATIRIDGLSARLPLGATARADGAPAKTEANAGDELRHHIGKAKIFVRGAKFLFDAASVSATAVADSVTATLDLVPQAGTTDATVEIETERELIKLVATRTPSTGVGADVVVDTVPRARDGVRLSARTRVGKAGSLLRADAITGVVNGTTFTGAVAFDTAAPQSLAADLRLDAVMVTEAPAAQPRPAGFETATIVHPSDIERLDVTLLDGLQADIAVAVDRLQLGPMRLGQIKLKASGKDRVLDVNLAADSFYEGTVRGRYVLAAADDRTPLHQLSLSIGRARLGALLFDATQSRVIDGTATARIEAQASGARADAILRSAVGAANVSIADGAVSPRGLLEIAGLAGSGKGQGGGGVAFGRLDGAFALKDGRAQSSDLRLESSLIGAGGAGFVDYVAQTVDFTFKPDLSRKTGEGGLNIPVRVVGPWSDPQASADFGDVLANPGKALQTLQDIGAAVGSSLAGKPPAAKGRVGRSSESDGAAARNSDGLDGLGEALGGLLEQLFRPGDDADTGGRSRRR